MSTQFLVLDATHHELTGMVESARTVMRALWRTSVWIFGSDIKSHTVKGMLTFDLLRLSLAECKTLDTHNLCA